MKRPGAGRKKSLTIPENPRSQGRRVIPASEFKARCLRLLEEVASGQEVLVTKRGQEVALVIPVRRTQSGSSRGSWKGMATVKGDIVRNDWSAEFDATR